MLSSTCPRCGGRGEVVAEACDDCSGRGAVQKERRVIVTFPAGIDAGQRLRVQGQGMPGPKGSPSGDLYVEVAVENDERFERSGFDLHTQRRLSFRQAALGGELEVELPDGTQVSFPVEPGTQPGAVMRVRGMGIPRLDRKARGDLLVHADVIVPRSVSKKARKLLEELDAELGRHTA